MRSAGIVTVALALAAATWTVAAAQSIQRADGIVPPIIGEYGPNTANDPNDPVVTAIITAGSNGQVGSSAWAWDDQGTVDPTTRQDVDQITLGSGLTTYGQMVALFINEDVVPPSQRQLTAAARTAINTATASLQTPAAARQ